MKEVFGIIWIDNILGPLSLIKPDAQSAIATAKYMRKHSTDKIRDCRAVRIPAEINKLENLEV
jgi:hypothetical protein